MQSATLDELRRSKEFIGGNLEEVPLSKVQELSGNNPRFRQEVEEFLAAKQATDQIYFYATNQESWRAMMGSEGYLLVRRGQIISRLMTKMN